MNGRRPWLFLPFTLRQAQGERGLNQSFFKRLNLMHLKQTAVTLSENELARINAWLP